MMGTGPLACTSTASRRFWQHPRPAHTRPVADVVVEKFSCKKFLAELIRHSNTVLTAVAGTAGYV